MPAQKDRRNFLRLRFQLLGIALVAVLAATCWWNRKPKGDPDFSDALATQGLPLSLSQASAADSAFVSQRSETTNNRSQGEQNIGVTFDRYGPYLNKLCALLTEAEEDRLLAASGRDEKVLIGLVFAHSARAKQWLKEALLKAPDDPLVHYAVLSRAWTEFDHLHSALELAKLTPDDAAPLHVAALESLKLGDRTAAIAYLTNAAERSQFSSLFREAIDTAVDVYRQAGRPESDATARMLLQENGQWESVAAWNLNERLKILGPDGRTLWGSDEITSLLINAHQQALASPYSDIGTYTGAREDEIRFLRAIAASPIERLSQYLPVPASEMLANSQAELAKVDGIAFFAHDKPGIYQRLDQQEKSELINRIYQDGEVSAFRWAYQTRPDIFRSPDFVPQGVWPGFWTQMLKQDGPLLRP